jgi:hypothetical protein
MSLSPTLEISTSLLMFPIKFSFDSLSTHLSNLTFLGLPTLQILKVCLCHLVYFVYNTTYEESWMGVSTQSPNKLTFIYATFIFIHIPLLVAFTSFWNLFQVQHNNPSHHIERQHIVLSWVLQFELPSPMQDMNHEFMHEKSYFLD